MPKVFGKELSWVFLGPASVLGLYLVYIAIFPAEDAPRAAAPKKAAKKTTDKNSIFTQADTTAKFAVMTETPKNSFKPLIVKTGFGSPGPNGPAGPPPGVNKNFADGEEGWGYTGYVVLDGKPQALLENPGKGEALYVQSGDTWKHSKIAKITPEEITLKGSGGSQTVKLGDISEPKKAPGVVASNGVAPVNPGPALQGAIGNGLPGVQGNGAAGTPGANANVPNNNPFTDLNVQPDAGFGRRGRGRRNRGGGNFPNQ